MRALRVAGCLSEPERRAKPRIKITTWPRAGSPWQNGFAERLIGSIRRECLDHVIVFGEEHLRRVLRSYADYYNEVRTHRSLNKDAPMHRPVLSIGSLKSRPILGDFITSTSESSFGTDTYRLCPRRGRRRHLGLFEGAVPVANQIRT
jgi:hypothetical protein